MGSPHQEGPFVSIPIVLKAVASEAMSDDSGPFNCLTESSNLADCKASRAPCIITPGEYVDILPLYKYCNYLFRRIFFLFIMIDEVLIYFCLEMQNCFNTARTAINGNCRKDTDSDLYLGQNENDDALLIDDGDGGTNASSRNCYSIAALGAYKNTMGNNCGLSNETYRYFSHPEIERYKREYSRNTLLRQILASSLGTCVSVLTLNPISVVKLRLQRQDIFMETSARNAVRTILKKDGIKGFWAGVKIYLNCLGKK